MKPRNMPRWLAVLVPLALAWGFVGTAGVAETLPLSAEEQSAAVEKIKGSLSFSKAAAGKRDPRLYAASAWKYRDKEATREGQEVIEVLFYKYEGGVTLRASLDTKTGKVFEVEELKAYPCPLAGEERAAALRLAREQSPAVQKLLAALRAAEVGVNAISPVISDPNDPLYGHRVAYLTVYSTAQRSARVRVVVDLTAKSVKPFAL